VSEPDRVERQRLGCGAAMVLLAGLAGMVLAIVLAQVTLPYAIMTPGPIANTLGEVDDGTPLIAVDGAPTFPTDGELNFTTVRVRGGPGNETSIAKYVEARLSSDATILPLEQVFQPGATQTEIQEENEAEMVGSQQEAAAAALRALGYAVRETVTVAGVADESAFADLLQEGDLVTAVAGVPTDGADAIRDEVAKVAVGDEISVTVVRDATEVTLEAPTIDAGGRPVLGIFLSREFDSDVDVTITAGEVGGPSAGMMFALGIYDVLTEGSLTGGQDISGTGTITADGVVGPIGGALQKVFGARDAGSDYFIAPRSNCDDLTDRVPDDIEVFAVESLDEALAVVGGIAEGDLAGLPRCG
jgi:PDZ domain-containing protein